jgi:hypothetical protein
VGWGWQAVQHAEAAVLGLHTTEPRVQSLKGQGCCWDSHRERGSNLNCPKLKLSCKHRCAPVHACVMCTLGQPSSHVGTVSA